MVKVYPFGTSSKGISVNLYEIENKNGAKVVLTDFGATIVKIIVPDKNGNMKDIVLGYGKIEDYENNDGYFGATIGRYANRISNGEFSLNGSTYHLAINDLGVNTLHGGDEGFDKKVWNTEYGDSCIVFSYLSPDMEENFPGNLSINVKYDFSDNDKLHITYTAQSDKDTIINIANHTYFNLDGHDGEVATAMHLMLNAPWFTPINEYLQPSGEILSVKNTPFDFTLMKKIGEHIDIDNPQLKNGNGYDHNFVLIKKERNEIEKCAELFSGKSGICMEVFTSQPAVQFYTGNFITERSGKDGVIYGKHQGICLETQHFPDSSHNAHFPSPVLRKGDIYKETTSFKFSVT